MSPKRLDGHEPAETHTFLDRGGEPCKAIDAWQVVVTREPEFDADTVDEMTALLLYEDSLCEGCGNDLDVTTRGDVDMDVGNDKVCAACAARLTVQRDDDMKHGDDKPVRGRPMWSDGRRYTVRPVIGQ